MNLEDIRSSEATQSLIFTVLNRVPLPVYLLMILLPTTRLTQFVVRSKIAIWLLSVSYLVLMAISMTGPSSSFNMSDFTQLNTVLALFARRDIMLVGWVHYLAFDLFVASWIFVDNFDGGRPVPHVFIIPTLLMVLMFGPVGLVLYSILKLICARKWIFDSAGPANKTKAT